jgi:hypothetical protein
MPTWNRRVFALRRRPLPRWAWSVSTLPPSWVSHRQSSTVPSHMLTPRPVSCMRNLATATDTHKSRYLCLCLHLRPFDLCVCLVWSGLVCPPTERVAPRSTSAPMLLNSQRPVATKPSPTHGIMHSAGSSCPDALLHVPIVCFLSCICICTNARFALLRAPHHPLLVEAKSTHCRLGAPRVDTVDALSHVS